MKKIFDKFKFIQKFSLKINMPHIENTKLKKCAIRFMQNNIFLIFATLIFALVTRPFALDVAEFQGYNADVITENTEEEKDFPFLIIKPQEGLDRCLTRAEMRWIFKEEMRLNAMKKVIGENNERAHKAYSAMVQDFNVRGANFKYELRDKTSAKEDIEPYREEIEQNAVKEARSYGWGQL